MTASGSTGFVPAPGLSHPVGQGYGASQPPGVQSYNPPGPPPHQPESAAGKGSRNGLLTAIGVGSLALIAGLGVLWTSGGNDSDDENQAQPLAASETVDGDPSSDSAVVPPDSTVTSPPTTQPTSTVPATTAATVRPRPAALADLPSLPSVESPYGELKTITEPEGAFVFRVPVEWAQELAIEGQVIVSPDNNAALGGELINGVLVSGNQGIGVWDAELFLNEILKNLSDPDAPCSELLREPYIDGPFDGLIHAQSCQGGDMLVVNVVVSSPARDAIIYIGVQLIDERDFAAFEEILDSFTLIDPELLPAAE